MPKKPKHSSDHPNNFSCEMPNGMYTCARRAVRRLPALLLDVITRPEPLSVHWATLRSASGSLMNPPATHRPQVLSAARQAYTDNDVSTTFRWERPHVLSSESTATLTWRVPADAVAGTYRLRHRGDYKHIFGGTTPFTGVSRESLASHVVTSHWE